MIKRTFYALTLLLILCVSGIQAQNTKFSKEEFRNRQKEFFIQQAGLSNDEAQKFFPLYFELQDMREYGEDFDGSPVIIYEPDTIVQTGRKVAKGIITLLIFIAICAAVGALLIYAGMKI